MSLISISKLPLTAEQGWSKLATSHPGLLKVFALLVLPLSLLPPAMLYFAGTHYPEMFLNRVGVSAWGDFAVIFFLAEMGTFLAMGWLIKQVAEAKALSIDYHDAYLLAAIAPVPLCLSSLGLLFPNLAFNAVLSIAAMAVSCGLIYHGVEGLCRTREGVTAAGIVQVVIGAGLVGWALLLLIVIL